MKYQVFRNLLYSMVWKFMIEQIYYCMSAVSEKQSRNLNLARNILFIQATQTNANKQNKNIS